MGTKYVFGMAALAFLLVPLNINIVHGESARVPIIPDTGDKSSVNASWITVPIPRLFSSIKEKAVRGNDLPNWKYSPEDSNEYMTEDDGTTSEDNVNKFGKLLYSYVNDSGLVSNFLLSLYVHDDTFLNQSLKNGSKVNDNMEIDKIDTKHKASIPKYTSIQFIKKESAANEDDKNIVKEEVEGENFFMKIVNALAGYKSVKPPKPKPPVIEPVPNTSEIQKFLRYQTFFTLAISLVGWLFVICSVVGIVVYLRKLAREEADDDLDDMGYFF